MEWGLLKECKGFGNAVQQSIISCNDEAPLLEIIPLHELHLIIRPVNSLYEALSKEAFKRTSIVRTTVRRIRVDDLNLFSYKLQILQKQSTVPKMKRLTFAKLIAGKVEEKEIDIDSIDWSGEVHFTFLDMLITEQEDLGWLQEDYWSVFNENNEGSRVTVNDVRYLDVLKSYYIPTLKRRKELGSITFQQDDAPPHITKVVLDFLREKFDKQLISRNCDFFWPPYSPDLNPCDFYLWGYLKSKVYSNPIPETTEDLKRNIRWEIRRIKAETLKKVSENILTRLQKVISLHGS
ncbi:hypothetical protein LOD99_7131 [Oopsacas minuta]|uniref:Transposase n=1 Tax=Oopsacas minuta TaxID=111878 RepID=A0AAV7JK22_9METZ|nr:hypothetical protein LOD99_7131 [Oopsacas minuta]